MESKQSCVAECPDQYMGKDNNCVKCSSCLTCYYDTTAKAELCLSCATGTYLNPDKTCL